MNMMNFPSGMNFDDLVDQSFRSMILLGIKCSGYSKDYEVITNNVIKIGDSISDRFAGTKFTDTNKFKETEVSIKVTKWYPVLRNEGLILDDGTLSTKAEMSISFLEQMLKMMGVDISSSILQKKVTTCVDNKLVDEFKIELQNALLKDYEDYVEDDVDLWKELSLNAPSMSISTMIDGWRSRLSSFSDSEFNDIVIKVHEDIAKKLLKEQEE